MGCYSLNWIDFNLCNNIKQRDAKNPSHKPIDLLLSLAINIVSNNYYGNIGKEQVKLTTLFF